MPRRGRTEIPALGGRTREAACQTTIFRYPPAWRPIIALLPPPGEPIIGIEGERHVVTMEANLRRHLVWPATADNGGIAAAARAISTQLGPMSIDYHQFRSHVSAHLSALDAWLCGLSQELRYFDDYSNGVLSLHREVQALRAHLELLTQMTLDQARATPQQPEQSMFERIRQAQRMAARSRGSSPARSYTSETARSP